MHRVRTILLAGAVTAAFGLAGCATVEEAVVEKTAETYKATLTGAQEVGGGDPDGAGQAEITVADNMNNICWDLGDITGIGPITAAHIHRGARGVNGPPVFTLKPANEGGWKGCSNRQEWVEDALERNYANYYVNVHTAEYPNGAIRGQLTQ